MDPETLPLVQQVSLPPAEEPLPLDTGTAERPVPPEIARQRAFKARFGLSEILTGKSYEQFYQEMTGGTEQQGREQAAAQLDYNKALVKQALVQQIGKQYPNTLTASDYSVIDQKIKELDKPTDPYTVYEENYAKAAIDQLNKTARENQNTFWADAERLIPGRVEELKTRGNTLSAKQQTLMTKAENLKSVLQEQSWAGWGADFAKFLIPFYADYKLRGKTETSSFSGLLGSHLEDQAKDLWAPSTDLATFKTKVDTIVEDIAKDNPMAAAMWLSAMMGQSGAEKFMNNTFNVVDLTVLPIGKGVKSLISGIRGGEKAVELNNSVAKAVQDVVEAAKNPNTDKANLIAATGDVGEAAVQRATSNLLKELQGAPEQTKRAVEGLFTFLRQDVIDLKANPGRLTTNQVNAIESRYVNLIEELGTRLGGDLRVDRLPFIAEETIRKVQESMKGSFKGLGDNILDVGNIRREPFSNTYFVDIAFGAGPGKLFEKEYIAKAFAGLNNLPGYTIEQQGTQYYINVSKSLRETDDVIRKGLIETDFTQAPNGFLKNFLGWLRTPEDTLSQAERANRKAVTYGPSNLLELAKNEAREISKLMKGSRLKKLEITDAEGNTKIISKKDMWNDWENVVRRARNMDDPAKPGEKGYFFESPAKLDEHYLMYVGRLPELAETEAYFSYKRFLEMDRILRNISVFRNKARIGTENHTFYALDVNGQRVKSNPFDGVTRKELPGGEDSIVVTGRVVGEERIYSGGNIPTRIKEVLKKGIKEGRLKVTEVWDPEIRPLSGFGKIRDERIRYVISDNLETKPLSWDQVPRRGGGHYDYDYDYYIKQAKVRLERVGKDFKHWYEGDNVVMPIALHKMGVDVVDKMNAVRVLLREGNEEGAKELAQRTLPINWDEFHGWFKPGRDPEGNTIPPRLDLKEPFMVTGNHESILNIDKGLESRYPKTFKDGTREGSLARQYQVAYTGPRDAYDMKTFVDIGTKGNPLYSYEPAKLVDPIPSMHRALSRITNSFYMDDYKISAVEHWLQEARNFMKASDSEIKHSPFWHFNNPEYKRDAPADQVSRLKNMHLQIQQLTGVPSSSDAFFHSVAQKLSDASYTGLGPKGAVLEPAWLMPKIKDPFKFIRSATYHVALGFYAIPQLLTQLQTHATIQAVAGVRAAVPGAAAAQFYHYMSFNKNAAIVNKLDSMASHFGWKVGEWKEAAMALEKTGFQHVGGEYVNLNNALTPKAISNGWETFLDAGTFFFKQGEQNVRYAAWFTAFKEFKVKNPTAPINEAATREILNRADLLNINMSRASASIMNHGAASVTTQFLTYQIRLAELFFSKRIDNAARARMLLTNATLYGAPTATGVFGLPLSDFIRQKATEGGYQVGERYLTSLVNEGLPAVLTAIATGKGDMQAGTFPNFGDRLGTQGFETLRDVARGDKPWWEILGGAAYSKFSGAFGAMSPFYNFAMSAFREDDKYFQLKPEHMLEPLKEISSVNAGLRAWYLYNTSNWLSKKGAFLEESQAPLKAALATLATGLQPQQVVDLQILNGSRKEMNADWKRAEDKFLREWRYAFKNHANPEQANQFFRNGIAILNMHGYPEEKRMSLFSRAEAENQPLVDRMNWDYWTKTPRLEAERNKAIENYSQFLKLRQKQRGE